MSRLGITLLAILVFVAFIGVMCLYHAWVIATLWAWFIVPLGVTKIGIAHAYGISTLITAVIGVRGLYAPEDKRQEALVASFLMPIIALFFGWIALGFM